MYPRSPTLLLTSCLLLIPGFSRAEQQAPQVLTTNGATLSIDLDDSHFTQGIAPILTWIQHSAGIVSGYYGQFPVSQLMLHVRSTEGHGVRGGTTYGYHGGMIRITVGSDATEAELANDWVLVHEMTHLALPDVGEQHHWLSEGLATYIEGIARAQAGNRTEKDVWAEQVRSMPKGLPQPGDEGLDRTHTWGRTYWGGALFALMADVEIHRRTQNKYSLQDAMRAVARASGGLGADWPVERVFATGDAATGTRVLEELYAQWRDKPVSPDLPALWRDLGIEPDGTTVRLRDDAPLSAIRRAIMRRS